MYIYFGCVCVCIYMCAWLEGRELRKAFYFLISMEVCNKHHVLLFPFPAEGHIKPFLCLAQLLCNAGLRVTFLNTHYNHRRIHNRRRLAARFPLLHFESISDGLPLDEPRDLLGTKFYVSILKAAVQPFRNILVSHDNGTVSGGRPPITCVISDVIFRFPIDVAEELGVPVFCFCILSARYLFLYFWIPKLIENGQLPYREGNIDQKLHGVGSPAEAEGLLSCKDLPGFWSTEDTAKNDPINFVTQTVSTSRSSGLILNTFEELEAPFLAILSNIYNKIYTMGPIHSLLKNSQSDRECGLWKEDDRCLAWLDSQPRRSVLFVSFGSLVKIKSGELVEFWNGLVNSGKPFLMVLRSDAIEEEGEDEKQRQRVREIMEKREAEDQKWRIVNWAPQEEVLAHEAIGGFLTHSGWNSTLESLAAGVPMISWPHIGDQPSNCTWLSKVWKIGLQMEDPCHRSTVEAMARSLMEEQGEEMHKTVAALANRAKKRVTKDGTSYRNLQTLVEDIKKTKLT